MDPENFLPAFNKASNGLNENMKDDVIRSFTQYSDATSIFKGKGKNTVLDQGQHTRSVLIDAAFSLDTVCKNMFNIILQIVKKDDTSTAIDQVADRFEKVISSNIQVNLEIANRLREIIPDGTSISRR